MKGILLRGHKCQASMLRDKKGQLVHRLEAINRAIREAAQMDRRQTRGRGLSDAMKLKQEIAHWCGLGERAARRQRVEAWSTQARRMTLVELEQEVSGMAESVARPVRRFDMVRLRDQLQGKLLVLQSEIARRNGNEDDVGTIVDLGRLLQRKDRVLGELCAVERELLRYERDHTDVG